MWRYWIAYGHSHAERVTLAFLYRGSIQTVQSGDTIDYNIHVSLSSKLTSKSKSIAAAESLVDYSSLGPLVSILWLPARPFVSLLQYCTVLLYI
jgi:hypothetical protein